MHTSRNRYFIKTYFKSLTKNNKKKVKKLILLNKNKNKNLMNIFFKNKIQYHPIFLKKKYEFSFSITYQIYQYNLNFLKKKFNNLKYAKLLDLIKSKRIKSFFKNSNFLSKLNINSILNFIFIYKFFFYSIYIDIFFFIKFIKSKKRLIYFLILSFKKKKLYINFKNINKKNYLSLSTGLFIKFFEKRKSIKKNKAIKLLMAKYLRKLFIISKIKNIILIIKKTPIFISEIVNFFNLPIAHKFLNPIEQKIIEELPNDSLNIKFLYFIFSENKNFSKNKLAQKGRIKRKILRKVTFENKIVD